MLKKVLITLAVLFVLVVVGFPALLIGGTIYYAHAQGQMERECRNSGGIPSYHTSGDFTSCMKPEDVEQ